jgi:glycosyltransferase involved in cell wall biosynthesis
MRVICLGRISPQKRITEIIDVVEQARVLSKKDIKLTVAGPCGKGEYAAKIRQIAKARTWITLVDGVFGKAKDALLRSGSFAVHARRDEEFGIAVAEYLKAGLIPLVPDEGGSREVVDRPELSYSTNKDAAAKLARLVLDSAFAETMRSHCQSRALEFSRDKYEKRQNELLEKILAEPSR